MSFGIAAFGIPLVYLTFRKYEWVLIPGARQIRLQVFLSRMLPRGVVLVSNSYALVAQQFGAGDFSMRVWLDPNKLASRSLTATDLVRAIREQNVQVAAGVLGAPPVDNGKNAFQLLVNAQGRLTTEEEFGNIIVLAAPQITRIRDLGRVELGAGT